MCKCAFASPWFNLTTFPVGRYMHLSHFTLPCILFSLFSVISIVSAGGRAPSKQPPPKQSKPRAAPPSDPVLDPFAMLNPNLPLMTQIIQKDFLVQPEDFDNQNVKYLTGQLNRAQSVELYYRSAEAIYDGLGPVYEEMQASKEISSIFLDIMQRLTRASMNEPLTITNIVYAVCRHLRPLFKTVIEPIEEINRILYYMEKTDKGRPVGVMIRFFQVFTLREMNVIQDFIKMMSLAVLRSDLNSTDSAGVKPLAIRTSQKQRNIPMGYLDIRPTGALTHGKRARLTVSNALAKMLVLMDLFVSDPSVLPRTIEVFRHLWEIHLTRMSAKEGIPEGECDPVWYNPILYRKMPINFKFEDWSPGLIPPDHMASLVEAAQEERRQSQAFIISYRNRLAEQEKLNFVKKVSWIVFIVFFGISVIAAAIYSYFRRKSLVKTGDDRGEEN